VKLIIIRQSFEATYGKALKPRFLYQAAALFAKVHVTDKKIGDYQECACES
jgi:hypothetical protein